MIVNSKYFTTLADKILEGHRPTLDTYRKIAFLPEKDVFSLFAGADLLRESCFGRRVHPCTIVNGKPGKCSEDCAFCAQSWVSMAEAPVYPLLPRQDLQAEARRAENTPIHRFSIVTSGGRLSNREVGKVAAAISPGSADPIPMMTGSKRFG